MLEESKTYNELQEELNKCRAEIITSSKKLSVVKKTLNQSRLDFQKTKKYSFAPYEFENLRETANILKMDIDTNKMWENLIIDQLSGVKKKDRINAFYKNILMQTEIKKELLDKILSES